MANPVLDTYDANGETPYQIEEVLKNRVWRVGYRQEQFFFTRAKDRQNVAMLDLDPMNLRYQQKAISAAKEYGQEAVDVVKKDFEKVKVWFSKNKFSKEELFDEVPSWNLNMMVVKLKSGGLLLYAPVKIHKEDKQLLFSWLESLGPVKWLVVASSAHTLCVPDAVKAFPDARIVGPKAAEEKLRYIGVLEKFDLLTDTKKDLDELNKELYGDGVELFNIEGDIACSSIICLVEKEVLLECDIVYGHQDGHGLLDLNGSVLKQWRPEDLSVRLFKLALVSKPNSPNGFLPNYRFWLMDPESLGALGYNIPCKDGSSHKAMAHSLRELLKQQYKIAIGVHFNGMPREDFRNSVDMAWNWLDQKSLKLS